MSKWVLCLTHLARINRMKEYWRDRLRYAYRPSTTRQPAERERLETLEPRLLFSSTIGGAVYGDTNLDGLLGSQDVPLAGMAVYIDQNHSGARDESEPVATTGPDGRFSFTGLSAGSYQVSLDLPADWQSRGVGGRSRTIQVNGEQAVSGLSFLANPALDYAQLLKAEDVASELGRIGGTRLAADGAWNYVTSRTEVLAGDKLSRDEVRLETLANGVRYTAPLKTAIRPTAERQGAITGSSRLDSINVSDRPDYLRVRPTLPADRPRMMAVSTTDLLLHYTFDEQESNYVLDASPGGGNHLFVNGSINWLQSAARGGGITLSKPDKEYLNVGSAGTINSLTKNYTLATWINPTATSGTQGIVTKVTSSSEKQFALTLNGSQLQFDAEVGGNNWSTSGGSISANTWTHVAVTVYEDVSQDIKVQFYVNGQPVGSAATMPAEVNTSTADLVIGRWGGSYINNDSYQFDGGLDDVRIYDGAMTAQEVANLYSTTPPTVSVEAVNATATEAGNPAQFVVSRTGSTSGDLAVWYRLMGSAGAGDYSETISPSTLILIPDGSSSVTVTLTPAEDTLSEGTEFVRFVVLPQSAYVTDPSAYADIITIGDNEPAVTAVGDTFLWGGSANRNLNFGHEDYTQISEYNTASQFGSWDRDAYFEFDVTGLKHTGLSSVILRVTPTWINKVSIGDTLNVELIDPSDLAEYNAIVGSNPIGSGKPSAISTHANYSIPSASGFEMNNPLEIEIPITIDYDPIADAIANHGGRLAVRLYTTDETLDLNLATREHSNPAYWPTLVGEVQTPTADISSTSSVVAGQAVSVTLAAPADANTSWVVDWGDGVITQHPNVGVGVSVNHTYSVAGTYTVRAIAIGADGRRLDGLPNYIEEIAGTPGLVGLWTFDEPASEAAGGAANTAGTTVPDGEYVEVDVTNSPDPRTVQLGQPGWLFDGYETAPYFYPGYVEITDSSALSQSSPADSLELANGTISFYYKDDGIHDTGLFSKDAAGTGAGHLTISVVQDNGSEDQGYIRAVLDDGTGGQVITSSTGGKYVQKNRWHLVTFSWGAGGMKLCIDGELAAQNTSVTTGLVGNDEIATIGASRENVTSGNPAEAVTSGSIDQLAIFNQQLTDQAVRDLYFAEAAILTLTPPSGADITLVEDSDLQTTPVSEGLGAVAFMVPATPDGLRIDFADLSFDSGANNPFDINDAFEIAIYDSQGNSILPTIGEGADAQLNITQGQVPLRAAGVALFNAVDEIVSTVSDAGYVLIDISSLSGLAGQDIIVVPRLLNNDADSTTQVTVGTPVATAYQADPVGANLSIAADLIARRSGVSFASLTDVTSSFDLKYGVTRLDQAAGRLHVSLDVTKAGPLQVRDQLVLALRGIVKQTPDVNGGSSPVQLAEFDGLVPLSVAGVSAGTPYFDLSERLSRDANGFYHLGASLENLTLVFEGLDTERFDYELVVLGLTNHAPSFTSNPYDGYRGGAYPVVANPAAFDAQAYLADPTAFKVLELVAGQTLSYQAVAADPELDGVTYSVLSGPGTNATFDQATGLLTWTSDSGDLGTHTFRLRVTDEYGLHDSANDQVFKVRVVPAVGNRPPSFVTDPIPEAQLDQPYTYTAQATDPDGDTLTYGFDAALTEADDLAGGNFAVDPNTGEVTWTPSVGPITLSPGAYTGVASLDGHVGSGYMMYTAESVHTRFAGAVFGNNNRHFISVIHENGQWYYFNNDFGPVAFTPRPTDVLVASIQFNGEDVSNPGLNTVQDLKGTEGFVHGIASGYASGNLVFVPGKFHGTLTTSSRGEFDVLGTIFTPNLSSIIGQQFDIYLTADDGRGGLATQPYTIQVKAQPNHAPVFTKLPATHYVIPGDINTASDVEAGQTINISLGQGETFTVTNATVTVPGLSTSPYAPPVAVVPGQMVVEANTDAATLRDVLLGSNGVGLANPLASLVSHQESGSSASIGIFVNDAGTYGLGPYGIVLSTGDVKDYYSYTWPASDASPNGITPNPTDRYYGSSGNGTAYGGEPLQGTQLDRLESISGNNKVYLDPTQFDVSFDVDEGVEVVYFQIAIGSEEWSDFVGSDKIDAFGIFVTDLPC